MKKYVLIVDDEPDHLALMGTIVTEMGLVAVTASSSREALQKLRKQNFACIVTDMKLRDGTGEEVIAFIRDTNRVEVNSATPIVMVSGKVDKELLEKVGKRVNGILVKPFTPDDLKNKLAHLLAADGKAT